MSSRGTFSAIQTIRSWTVQDVVSTLNKNGLGDCSDAFQKREIDGDNLLNLTEGMLSLWKRDLTLPAIRKVVRFVSDLNSTPEKYVLKEFERHITTAKKPSFGSQFKGFQQIPMVAPSFKPVPSPPVRSRTPISDAESFDSDFENYPDTQEEMYSNHPAALLVEDVPKPSLPTKPALPIRPPGFGGGNIPPKPILNGGHPLPNRSILHGSGIVIPKPIFNMPHLENIISNLNLPSVENDEDYYEDEEYESIDEALGRPHNLGLHTHQPTPPMLPPPREPKRSNSEGVSKPVGGQNSRPPAIPPVPGGRTSANSPHYPKHTFGGANSRPEIIPPPPVRSRSPSRPPEHTFGAADSRSEIVPSSIQSRNNSPPYPKHTFPAVGNRPPIPVPSVNPKNEGPTFTGGFNIPAGIPNKMSGYAFKNANLFKSLPSPSNESTHFSSSTSNLTTSNEHSNHRLSNSSSTNDWESDEYEVVDGDTMSEMDGTEYYLRPIQQSQNIPSLPSLPPKPKSLPQYSAPPQNRPPSPPMKISNEIVDSDGNKLSDLLRVALSTRKISTGSSPDMEQREKSPTPELQKSSLFDQKPPERLIQFPTTRPLPPTPPDSNRKPTTEAMIPRKNSRNLNQMPYFHDVDRKKAEELLKNSEDGKFLLRPSLQTHNQVTLTLWYNKRLYHIGVRQRPDQRFALGTEKAKELSFTSVEELVQFYQGEELVLFSAGERTGKTLLTTSPPRQPM